MRLVPRAGGGQRQEAADGTGHHGAGTVIGEDLLSHCLSFCTAIHTHHTSEDSQLLPALRAAAPELAPVTDNLTEDHALVAGILRQVRELLTPGRGPSGPDALVRELDGLIAILESHFSYEERRIAKALDTLGPLGRGLGGILEGVGGVAEAPASRTAVLEERYRGRLPGSLDELVGPGHGTVQLPLHVAWSGQTAFNLDMPKGVHALVSDRACRRPAR
jgi:Hemerythrin HHE cation binding domain